MVWGGISLHGKIDLAFISTKMNSDKYQNMLETHLVPFLEENSENDLIFQQDNASIHVSRSTREWFTSNNISILDWPSLSPDLNPIENVWGLLTRHVYANNRQFSSKEDLKAEIIRSWENLDQNTIAKIINSMPNRIFEVIRQNGAMTKY